MTLNEYQEACKRTGTSNPLAPTQRDRVLNFCLGLAGEVGELLDLLKKEIYHGKQVDLDQKLKELGDIKWYSSMLGLELGFTDEEVCTANVAKLRARYENGFSIEAANARKDEAQKG